MLPEASVSHQTINRLRLRIPSKKKDTGYLSELRERFAKLSGIESIVVNELTGSILFVHHIGHGDILDFGRVNNLFTLKDVDTSLTGLHSRVNGSFQKVNSTLKEFTGGEIDTSGLAFLVLLAMGLYEIGRGNIAAPAWYTAFWYALNIFLKGG